MPFSHNGLKITTSIQVFSQVNKYTLFYRFLYGNVQRCVFAKNRPVSLNWTDYRFAGFVCQSASHGLILGFCAQAIVGQNHNQLCTHSTNLGCHGRAQHAATNSQGQGHKFYSFSQCVGKAFIIGVVFGPYLLQGLAKFIITSQGCYP